MKYHPSETPYTQKIIKMPSSILYPANTIEVLGQTDSKQRKVYGTEKAQQRKNCLTIYPFIHNYWLRTVTSRPDCKQPRAYDALHIVRVIRHFTQCYSSA